MTDKPLNSYYSYLLAGLRPVSSLSHAMELGTDPGEYLIIVFHDSDRPSMNIMC